MAPPVSKFKREKAGAQLKQHKKPFKKEGKNDIGKAGSAEDHDQEPEDERFQMRRDPRFKPMPNKLKFQMDERFSKALEGEEFQNPARVDPFGNAVASEGSSSDTDGSDSESEADFEADEEVWEENEDSVEDGDSSSRLAIMNLDWDSVSATDIFVMLQTYLDTAKLPLSAGGKPAVKRVSIYPSDFGVEQMAIEATKGPQLEYDEKVKASLENSEEGEERLKTKRELEIEKDIQTQALRKYQKQRLRYFYAVAEFDSVSTAEVVYRELDGLAASFCSSKMDFRFVPDSLTCFPHPSSSVCERMPSKYMKSEGRTDNAMMQHAKVDCSWDSAPPARKMLTKKFKEDQLADMNLRDYLASDSEDGDDEKMDTKTARKLLLGSDAESELPSDDEDDEELKAIMGELVQPRDVEEDEAGLSGGEEEEDSEVSDEDELPFKPTQEGEEEGEGEVEGDMEFSYVPELEEKALKLDKKIASLKKDGRLKKGGLQEKSDDEPQTPWQKYLAARKEKKRQKKQEMKEKRDQNKLISQKKTEKSEEEKEKEKADAAELELLMSDQDETRDFELREKRIKKANKKNQNDPELKRTDDQSAINLSDPRLEALFNDPNFALDPTNQEFKKTEVNKELMEKRRKRKRERVERNKVEREGEKEGKEEEKEERVEEEGFSLVKKKKVKASKKL